MWPSSDGWNRRKRHASLTVLLDGWSYGECSSVKSRLIFSDSA